MRLDIAMKLDHHIYKTNVNSKKMMAVGYKLTKRLSTCLKWMKKTKSFVSLNKLFYQQIFVGMLLLEYFFSSWVILRSTSIIKSSNGICIPFPKSSSLLSGCSLLKIKKMRAL